MPEMISLAGCEVALSAGVGTFTIHCKSYVVHAFIMCIEIMNKREFRLKCNQQLFLDFWLSFIHRYILQVVLITESDLFRTRGEVQENQLGKHI